jgi:hypothetical protein
MRLRKRHQLSYTVPPAKGIEAVEEAFYRLGNSLTGTGQVTRRGTGEWRRACEASLRASRARRGLPSHGLPHADKLAIAAIYRVPPHLIGL